MARAIVKVDMVDDAFKRHVELFKKYQEQVKELPGAWGVAGEEIAKVGALNEANTAALLVQNQLVHEQEKAWAAQEKEEKRLLDLEKKRRNQIHLMWMDTVNMAKSVKNITLDLFRWVGIGGILSGLAGAGGLFGLDKLAQNVGDNRRTAQGYGTTTAGLRSANLELQRFIDPESVLQGISSAQANLGSVALQHFGINRSLNTDPSDVLANLLPKVKAIADRPNFNTNGPDWQFLQELGFTLQDMRRLHATTQQELRDSLGKAKADKAQLARLDQLSQRWQDLDIKLRLAGAKIENVFVDALGDPKLLSGLEQLSDAVATSLKTFLESPKIKEWLDDVGKGAVWLAGELNDPKFQHGIETFVADIGILAQKLVDALVWLHLIPDPNAGQPKPWQQQASDFGFKAIGAYFARGGPVGNTLDLVGLPNPLAWGGTKPAVKSLGQDFGDMIHPSAASLDAPPGGGAGAGGSTSWDLHQLTPGGLSPGLSPQDKPASKKEIVDALASFLSPGPVGVLGGESAGFQLNARNPTSGASGLAQWLSADRVRDFVAREGVDPGHASLQKQVDFIKFELGHKFAWVVEEMKRARSETERAFLFARDYEGLKGHPDQIATDLRAAIAYIRSVGQGSTRVAVVNQTGGSASIQVKQLPQ